jgi:hypothetical protein
MSEPTPIHITLQPDGVIYPTRRAAVFAANAVGTYLRALEGDDLTPPQMVGGNVNYQFAELGLDNVELKEAFQNWILSKGFQDLARGVRETLEEAAFFLRMLNLRLTNWTGATLQREIDAIRQRVANLTFPRLMAEVNRGLIEPLSFDEEFLSLQKARNCLEHRRGRVGSKDIDPAMGLMTLAFPRLRLFYECDGEEVEVVLGEPIFSTKRANPSEAASVEGTMIKLGRVTRRRDYAYGEPLIVTASDFYEIAMACELFATDVSIPRQSRGL